MKIRKKANGCFSKVLRRLKVCCSSLELYEEKIGLSSAPGVASKLLVDGSELSDMTESIEGDMICCTTVPLYLRRTDY